MRRVFIRVVNGREVVEIEHRLMNGTGSHDRIHFINRIVDSLILFLAPTTSRLRLLSPHFVKLQPSFHIATQVTLGLPPCYQIHSPRRTPSATLPSSHPGLTSSLQTSSPMLDFGRQLPIYSLMSSAMDAT